MRGSAGLIWAELCSEQTSLLVCELSKRTKKVLLVYKKKSDSAEILLSIAQRKQNNRTKIENSLACKSQMDMALGSNVNRRAIII